MNSKWNEKLNQVIENTLVIGMDIAESVHYACFVDKRGRIIHYSFAVHYWMNVVYFLDQCGIPLVMVNPLHVV